MPSVVERENLRHILLGIVITALIYAAATTIPVFGAFAILLIPLPIVVYRLRLGRRQGAIIPIVVFLIWLFRADGLTADLFVFLEQLVLGFALGEFLERGFPPAKIIGYAAGMVLMVGAGILLIYINGTGEGFDKLLSSYFDENISLYQEVYKEMGMPEENVKAITGMLDQLRYAFIRLIPGLSIAASLSNAWICMLLSRPILNAAKLSTSVFEGLNLWKVPEMLVWGVILCGGMMLIDDTNLRLIGLNGLIVLMQVYFFQGIAIVSFYFEKKQTPRAIRWVLYSLILLQMYMLVLVIVLGLFDMWLDFRKIKQPTETNGVS